MTGFYCNMKQPPSHRRLTHSLHSLDAVLVELDRLQPDGVDELLVDEEHELEAGHLEDGVVAQSRL